MSISLSADSFKRIIANESIEGIIGDRNPDRHHINVNVVGGAVSLSGDFYLVSDLIFNEGDVYDKEIIFDGGTFKKIVFRGGTFKKILFRRGTYNGFVSIRGGTFENLVLLGGQFNHWLGTLDGLKNRDHPDDEDSLAEEPLLIKRLEIDGGTYSHNVWLCGGEIIDLEIKVVTAIKIHCKPNDDRIVIGGKYQGKHDSRPRISNLTISRYSNKDNFFHFSDLKLETIKFENYTNIGNITIAKVSLAHSISIENSDLGRTTFIDCDFSEQRLIFDSSKITDIALAGSNLPKPENILSRSIDAMAIMRQKRLAFGQIKKIYQNMGDAVTASQYQARELETYREITSDNSEKFNLWLNRWSNQYGQSWVTALKRIIVVVSVSYTLYCISLGFGMEFSKKGVCVLFRNFGYILEFVNPIRKSDFLPKVLANKDEVSIPTVTYVIDSVAKIFNTYLIYQFIAAFRKHGKKSD